jgi:hypothetical protein
MIADPTASLDLVPAPVFRLVALLIFGMGAFMIALHSLIVAASAQRANLPPTTRLRAPIAVARGTPRARAWAILWNVLGLIDLIVAPASALATGAAVATIYPIAIVPLFVGPPLAVLLHVFSLRNLLVSQPAARTAHREAFAA